MPGVLTSIASLPILSIALTIFSGATFVSFSPSLLRVIQKEGSSEAILFIGAFLFFFLFNFFFSVYALVA
jgi:hypothetical protein